MGNLNYLFMNFLEEKNMSDGVVKAGDILKVDNFPNHQIDISVIRRLPPSPPAFCLNIYKKVGAVAS